MISSCVCGPVTLEFTGTGEDVKCPRCGRVYNNMGRYLWREEPTGEFVVGEEAHGERRAEDQDTAIEEAFAEGNLPEEDRRDGGDADPDEPAGAGDTDGAVTADDAKPAAKRGGRKKAQ